MNNLHGRVANFNEVCRQINRHFLWELEPLCPEIDFAPLKERILGKIICPLDGRKRLSFNYSAESGRYFCWVCQFPGTGTLLDFYCKKKETSFFEAFISLAKFFRIKLIWKKGWKMFSSVKFFLARSKAWFLTRNLSLALFTFQGRS